jgi:integrase
VAKSRHQEGRVEEAGKKIRKWRGHYYVYVQQENGTEVRRHRVVTLGLKAKLKKYEAEQKLREIITREVGTGGARPDDMVSLEWFWTNRFLPLKTWRHSTRYVVVHAMKHYVLSRFGDVRLCDLRKFDLQAHINKLAENYSKSIVGKACTWIRAVLEEAVEQEYLRKNPARKLVMPPTRATCKRFLTPEEYRKMLSVLTGRDRLIFRLFVFCAFRPGELFALRWRSFLSYALRIEEAVYHGKLGTPKTKGSAGLVTLPQSLAEELKAWYEESGQPAADEFIFPSKRGTPLDAHNYLRRDVLRPAAEKVGIKGLTFQALRRTFATHFHRVGTVKDQQAQMRHSNAQTTMNVYTQAVSESLKSAMEEFDRKMAESF